MSLLRYIFPRQFKLHNVFTSEVNYKEVAASFKNYAIREGDSDWQATTSECVQTRVPKRLRGQIMDLIRQLQKRHTDCAYSKLLDHYCPSPKRDKLSSGSIHFTYLASGEDQVTAFCLSVVRNVLSQELIGGNEDNHENWDVLRRKIQSFVKLRRFENLNLHDTMKGIKTGSITWLAAPSSTQAQRMARTDHEKRNELLAELLYWIFDSFLIPLIRTNFYVTESSSHRNRLFYFRHDVWRDMVQPAKAELKEHMLTKLDRVKASNLLDGRNLAYSQLRFMPKDRGMRPIANLRRRVPVTRNGMKLLGRSVNSTLTPVFNILNFEKVNDTV